MAAQDSGSWREQLKGLTFDVFGTTVNWRPAVEKALGEQTAAKIGSETFSSLPDDLQSRAKSLTDKDWATFAEQWRDSYGRFTHGFVPGVTAWKDIDTHHRDSLVELLEQWKLAGLFSSEEVTLLSRVWHFLDPWSDTSRGIHLLNTKFATSSLSNGNQSLLRDLQAHGDLGLQVLVSAEDFREYKPSPKVYLGACERLNLPPRQVAMVAAHLGDLEAARSCGMRTIYVERPGEEEWTPGDENYEGARKWVDIWVSETEEGFVEVARRLGII